MAEKKKHAGGRPPKYTDEMLDQVTNYCLLGATDKELSGFLDISEVTLNAYKKKYPEFLKSLRAGKEVANSKMARSLYQRGIGYSHPDVHISNYQGEITVTDITKHYPPDTAAASKFLNNRTRKQAEPWQDKQDVAVTGAIGINIDKDDSGL